MKRMTLAKMLFVLIVIYFLIYNTIFGWNDKPLSEAEKICDRITNIALFISFYFYISPIVEWIEKRVNEDETIS